MAGPDLVTTLRGFKIRTATLDKFLIAYSKPLETNSGNIPPFYDYNNNRNATNKISAVLHASSSLATILLVMPSIKGHDPSS
jgi:hypothetical protein